MDMTALQNYELQKQGRSTLSSLLLQPESDPKIKGVDPKKFSFRSMAADVMTAIGNFGLKVGTQLSPTGEPPASSVLAKSKRRKRLFADIDLDEKE